LSLQANGLPHSLGLAWLGRHGPEDESRFQRSGLFSAAKPKALPWAGMKDAVGVSEAGSVLEKNFVLRRVSGFRSAAWFMLDLGSRFAYR
jgi:hypothetical protein